MGPPTTACTAGTLFLPVVSRRSRVNRWLRTTLHPGKRGGGEDGRKRPLILVINPAPPRQAGRGRGRGGATLILAANRAPRRQAGWGQGKTHSLFSTSPQVRLKDSPPFVLSASAGPRPPGSRCGRLLPSWRASRWPSSRRPGTGCRAARPGPAASGPRRAPH